MMTQRRLAFGSSVVAFVCVTAAISACGGGGGTKTPSASRTAVATATPVAAATPAVDIRKLDLSSVGDVTELLASTGGQFIQRSVIYADLTDDGVDEAIVPISSGGTFGDVGFVVLEASGAGTKTLLKVLPLGETHGVAVDVVGGQLVLTQGVYGPEDPNCCPGMVRVTTYVWNGTSLAVQRIKTEANPSGGGKTSPTVTP